MPWTLKFWNASPALPATPITWSYGSHQAPADLPWQQEQDIIGYLSSIAAASTLANNRLNAYGQDIRVGFRSGDAGSAFAGAHDDYVLIDLTTARTVHFFNTQGKLVLADVRLTLMHELAHIYLLQPDPSAASEAIKNGAAFDFRGAVVDEQNAIAENASLSDQIQTAYDAGLSSTIDSAVFNMFVVNSSYSDDREVDITRFGTASADNVDHSARTQTTVPDMIRDLLFGLGGDDTLKGGNGDDFLYGGGDPTKANSGQDKLYGGEGSDRLYGGDANDFLNSGLTVVDPETWEFADLMDGGTGNDVLILMGESVETQGGAGDDQFWAVSTPGFGSYLTILDSEVGDSLYWDGYRLLGGTKSVIELEMLPEGNYHYVRATDSNGYLYDFHVNGTLTIDSPRGGVLVIQNFENGDFGIDVGDPIEESDFVWEYDPDTQVWTYHTSLPLGAMAMNGQVWDLASLPGHSTTAASDGPYTPPDTWLI